MKSWFFNSTSSNVLIQHKEGSDLSLDPLVNNWTNEILKGWPSFPSTNTSFNKIWYRINIQELLNMYVNHPGRQGERNLSYFSGLLFQYILLVSSEINQNNMFCWEIKRLCLHCSRWRNVKLDIQTQCTGQCVGWKIRRKARFMVQAWDLRDGIMLERESLGSISFPKRGTFCRQGSRMVKCQCQVIQIEWVSALWPTVIQD